MNFIKRIYIASIVLSLAFFAACGDSESSNIARPDDPVKPATAEESFGQEFLVHQRFLI